MPLLSEKEKKEMESLINTLGPEQPVQTTQQENIPTDYRTLTKQIATEEGIDPNLFTRIIQQESSFNPKARSPKGAIGLAQLMPTTAKQLGVDPTDPTQNLRGGARYFKQMLDKYGDVDKALAAYNAGPGAVDKYQGVPPYKETQDYVTKIRGNQEPGIDDRNIEEMLETFPDQPLEAPSQEELVEEGLYNPPIEIERPEKNAVLKELSKQFFNDLTNPEPYLGITSGISEAFGGRYIARLLDTAGELSGLSDKNYFENSIDYYKQKEPISNAAGQLMSLAIPSLANVNPSVMATKAFQGKFAQMLQKLPGFKKASKLSQFSDDIASGAVAASTYHLQTNPDATSKSTWNAAQYGALTTMGFKLMAGAGKLGKEYVGQKFIKSYLKTPKDRLAKQYMGKIGTTWSNKAAQLKNKKMRLKWERKLQNKLDDIDDYVDLPDEVTPSDIKAEAEILKQSKQLELAAQMDDLANQAINQNSRLKPSQINELKRYFWRQAYNKPGQQLANKTAQTYQREGQALKRSLEQTVATKNPQLAKEVVNLNKKIGNAAEIGKHLQDVYTKMSRRPSLSGPEIFILGLAGPRAAPIIGTTKLLQSTPGQVGVGMGAHYTGTALEQLERESIKRIGSQLLPKYLQKDENE